jgi:hypothetical protein
MADDFLDVRRIIFVVGRPYIGSEFGVFLEFRLALLVGPSGDLCGSTARPPLFGESEGGLQFLLAASLFPEAFRFGTTISV